MRHVDEGMIHAWLDEQLTDPAEISWIETHLRDCAECRARVADERATFDEAATLLNATALSAGPPSFEALAAKADGNMPRAGAPARELTRTRRERLVQWSWAASLVLAVAVGWTARELMDRGDAPPDPAPAIVEQSPAAEAAIGNTAPALPPATLGSAAAPVPARAAAPAVPPPVPEAANAGAERTEPRSQAAAPGPEADATGAAETVAQSAPPPATPPAPAMAAPASLATSRLERAAVADGQWRPVPRTEAAARTGMALYGIDGLEPEYTGLSADGAVVRTLYRLESGGQVELVQQRNVPGAPPVVDVQSTGRALRPGRTGGLAERQAAVPQPLTVVRGNVRLTLQTSSDGADLAALGMRLRLD